MTNDQDNYEAYYGDKLWNLLPAIYRALDTDQFNSNGPLRELVNRIGAQAATLRRSIDRMWEDQSIETCDDWVIPYIGDLLATNLVSSLDARGQRLDVAKTIYYRRRKGTLAILEEIAFDITGWNVKLVEFFRRLGRTRHGLDPAIGLATVADPDIAALQQAEGLVGPLSRTGIGGLADLRNVYGASKRRLGVRRVLPHGRLPRGARAGRLVRHPAARRLPLAAPELRGPPDDAGRIEAMPRAVHLRPDRPRGPALRGPVRRSFGDTWTSPAEWQLPTAITPSLLEPALGEDPAYPLYSEIDPNDDSVIPNALGVSRAEGGDDVLIPASDFTADPASLDAPTFSGPAASTPAPDFLIDPTHGRLVAAAPLPGAACGSHTIMGSPPRSGRVRTTVGWAAPRRRRPTRSSIAPGAGP